MTTQNVFPLRDVTAKKRTVESTEAIHYKVADNRQEREGAFRLIHDAYIRAGLAKQSTHGMRITPYHLLPSTTIFVALLRGQVISTVTLVADGDAGLPMEQVYPELVATRRSQGIRLAEVTCLADRRKHLARRLPVLTQLFRLMAQMRRNGVRQLVIEVHPRHAKFYERFLACDLVGEERPCPLVRNHPAVAMCLDFQGIDHRRPRNYNIFFGDPIIDQKLVPRAMSLAEQLDFARLSQSPTLSRRRTG